LSQKLLSIRAYARQKNVSDTAVRKHIKSGLVKLHGKKIDPEEADAALKQGIDPGQSEGGNAKLAGGVKPTKEVKSGQMVSLYEARTARANFAARREKIAVEREKMALDVKRGKLIERSEVERVWFEKARLIRDGVLNIPDRLASLLASVSDPHKVHQLLDTELKKALNDVADQITVQ